MKHFYCSVLALAAFFVVGCHYFNKDDTNYPKIPFYPHLKFSKCYGISHADTIFAMALIPKGPFKYGWTHDNACINYDYSIMKYEVTNSQYTKFLLATIKNKTVWADTANKCFKSFYSGDELHPPGIYSLKEFDRGIGWTNNSLLTNDTFLLHPVVRVTWFGAQLFCNYYKMRLPTAEEWEKAATGNTGYDFPWGNDIDSTRANYYMSNDPFEPGSSPVGFYDGQIHNGFSTKSGVSPYGCYDMAGNAWEWTQSYWRKHGGYCIGKGSAFIYHTGAFLRSYYVSCYGIPQTRLDICDKADGFRAVIDLKD